MSDYIDEWGNPRTSTGQIQAPILGLGSTSEQWASGVTHEDHPLIAQMKVRNRREAWGLDPYSGLPKPLPAGDYYPSSGDAGASGDSGAGALKFILRALLVGALLYGAVIGSASLWVAGHKQRIALAKSIDGFVAEKAIEGEKYAPFSAYAKYVPKKRAPASKTPEEINAQARKLLASRKPLSDKRIAYWGSTAWECLSENPLCLQQAGVRGEDMHDIRMLGLRFLDMARKKGSPDAAADIGLYLLSDAAPAGKDMTSALWQWDRAAKENPKAVRAQRLLDQVQRSPLASGAAKATTLLRTGL